MEFSSKNNNVDIVLTSRIRLARNVADMPFPQILSKEQANRITNEVFSAILDNEINKDKDYKLIKLSDLSNIERASMVENHLISAEHANNYERASVIINGDRTVSIMINEEDHIRLQVMSSKSDLKNLYDTASIIDNAIEEKITYAFDGNLGYLTSCPTNIGTGIRASIMMHLPALTLTKSINTIVNTVNQVGMTIRGFYGEGSNAMGNIYQISNQITLGLSEEEIINNLIGVSSKIIDNEISTREMLIKKQALELEDDIFRSYGMLKYTRLISASECLNLLSKVRMGLEMGIINNIDPNKLDELFTSVQPASLQLIKNAELDNRNRDIERAKLVREALA